MADARFVRAGDLIAGAHDANLPLVLLGGAAVATLCVSARDGGRYVRQLGDVDLATSTKASASVDKYLKAFGLAADKQFNDMNGYMRLRYFDADESHIDVFIDELSLCHVVSWKRSLQPGASTLPIAQLLLSKLQVVSLEAKDVSDLSALLTDQWDAIRGSRGELNRQVSNDWGLWRTSRGTLESLQASPDRTVAERAGELLEFWRAMRFGPKARARAIVGERVRWYQEPEEV